MPFSPLAPALFFEESDLRALVAEFSERIRRDRQLRPVLDHLVGNRWYEAEQASEAFFRATLFAEGTPAVDANWLALAVRWLDPAAIDALVAILLDCALVAFPLHGAALLAEITEQLATDLKAVLAADGVVRQRRLLETYARLRAGALMSRI
jgi:hypothetical protein